MQINEKLVDTHTFIRIALFYILKHEHIISFIHKIKSERIYMVGAHGSAYYVCGALFVNG